MKFKKFGLIIPTFLCCSFTGPRSFGNVIVTIVSYESTNIYPVGNFYFGHSFIHIKNDYSWPLQLPYNLIGPFNEMTIATWNANSTSSSSGGSSAGLINGPEGIYYNREAFIFSHTEERINVGAYLTIEVPTGQFNSLLTGDDGIHLLVRQNMHHNGLYNCSSFASEFFNLLSSDFDLFPGIINTPGDLRRDIISKGGQSFFEGCINLNSPNFIKYGDNGTATVYNY